MIHSSLQEKILTEDFGEVPCLGSRLSLFELSKGGNNERVLSHEKVGRTDSFDIGGLISCFEI